MTIILLLLSLVPQPRQGGVMNQQPDWTPGDVIAAYPDGDCILDDGITIWNPERARVFLEKRKQSSPHGALEGCTEVTLSSQSDKGE